MNRRQDGSERMSKEVLISRIAVNVLRHDTFQKSTEMTPCGWVMFGDLCGNSYVRSQMMKVHVRGGVIPETQMNDIIDDQDRPRLMGAYQPTKDLKGASITSDNRGKLIAIRAVHGWHGQGVLRASAESRFVLHSHSYTLLIPDAVLACMFTVELCSQTCFSLAEILVLADTTCAGRIAPSASTKISAG